MGGEKMQAINEYLTPLDEPGGANDNRLRLAAIQNSAGTDRNAWVTLADLVTALAEKRALLLLDDA
jgi:hypothetical protein